MALIGNFAKLQNRVLKEITQLFANEKNCGVKNTFADINTKEIFIRKVNFSGLFTKATLSYY